MKVVILTLVLLELTCILLHECSVIFGHQVEECATRFGVQRQSGK